jgi:hypothetical protein
MSRTGDNRPRINQRQAVDYIPKREPFRASELTARTVEGLPINGYGWIKRGEDYDAFQTQCHDITYVVWSFATPIAWWSPKHGWYVVKQRFSMITSTKHQSRLYMIPRSERV